MIEQPDGSDWVRPSSYQPPTSPPGPTAGPPRRPGGEGRPGRNRSGASRGRRGAPADPPAPRRGAPSRSRRGGTPSEGRPEPGDGSQSRRGTPPAPSPDPRGTRRARREAASEAAPSPDPRGTRRARREAASESAPQPRPGAGRSRRGSRGSGSRSPSASRPAARTTTRSPAPTPTLYEMPTDPGPAVDVTDVDGGGGPRRGRGGNGGGRGGGNGDGPAAQPRSSRGSNAKVMIVLGALIVPLLLAAGVVIVPNLLSSGGGGTGKTAPTVPGAQYKLFLRPGLTLSQIADVVATLPGHTKPGFLAAANSGRVRSHYEPPTTNSLEGLLAPDTYFIGTTESDDSILRRLVTHFDALADQVGVNSSTAVAPYQTIIIASLIGQEAKLLADSPQVAAVIYNRIRARMPLQIDATLCYLKGGCPPVPTNADKQSNSPYNTYKIAGLPPTPIASVTTSALQAALHPAAVPYIYYVIGDSTGKLVFATTLRQQQANTRAARAKGLL
jgi:uncharacterized YceG family protein